MKKLMLLALFGLLLACASPADVAAVRCGDAPAEKRADCERDMTDSVRSEQWRRFLSGFGPPTQQPVGGQTPMRRAGSTGCHFVGEETSGFNKICYYDCMGSRRAVTQRAVSLCPLTP